MIVTTMDGIANRITQETMGVVRGTHLWTRRMMKTSFGGIRHVEVTGVRDMDRGLAEAKDVAEQSMLEQARALGADAVIGVRIDVTEMSNGVFCVTTTGTAVKTMALPVSVPSYEAAAPLAAPNDVDFGFLAAVARPSSHGSQLRH
jgi:uncharacterized protein YbjQ (UPF0145 family)